MVTELEVTMAIEIPSIIIAFTLGSFLTLAAAVSGNSDRLCDRLGGTYTPEAAISGGDVCPDGKWIALFGVKP